jgi:hypothetical protein
MATPLVGGRLIKQIAGSLPPSNLAHGLLSRLRWVEHRRHISVRIDRYDIDQYGDACRRFAQVGAGRVRGSLLFR